MITPQFTLSQTDKHLLIELRAPYIKAQDVSLFVEDNLFIVSVSPYYLRLTLPGNVVEDDDSSAKYDIGSGMLSIALSKVNPGEHFPDLDMTNRLLARTGEIVGDKDLVKGPPRIQVMDDCPSDQGESDPWSEGAFDEALLFDFQIPQSMPMEAKRISGSKYGFNNQYSGHFLHIQNPDILTVVDTEKKSTIERWEFMRRQEDQKFDKEWYLADLCEPPDELIEILKYDIPTNFGDPFTAEEQYSLRNVGRKEFLIENLKNLYLDLPALLFAVLYDQITTLACPTSESPWTISRLSPSLSSLAPNHLPPANSISFSSLPPITQLKISLFRRVLTYPLYRNISLAEKTWNETVRCLKLGKRAVIRLLLSARKIFMDGGEYGVFLRIVWDDYIIWCQDCKDRVLNVLAEEMERVQLDVKDIGFRLDEIEHEMSE